MIIERHYDDEALIALLDSAEGFETVARDPHIINCSSCANLLASYRAIASVLGDAAMWDFRELRDEPVPETIATLRAFADNMARENADADAYVAALLAGPREQWMSNLLAHPEYRTAGTVRKLIEATDPAIDTMPPDAVEITRLAVEIAEHLAPSEATTKLLASAWRETAYALFYVGNVQQALPAIQRSTSLYDSITVDEYDRARADLVEALVLQRHDDLASSRHLAAESAMTFKAFGDERRHRFAMMTTAMIAHRAKDFRTALEICTEIEAAVPDEDYSTKTTLIQNIASCYRHLGDLDSAVGYLHKAMALQEFYGIRTSRARTCWTAAMLVFELGKYDKALAMLEDARREFESLTMLGEATFVSLDIAETLLQLGRKAEVADVCRAVLRLHSEAGLASAQPQMAALAYLSEVASAGQLTPKVIHRVRDRLKRTSNSNVELSAYPAN